MILVRTLVYATLFIGLLLVFLPRQILNASGIQRPAETGPMAWIGMVVAIAGAALALWCILSFVHIGKGTPAPFDPPRRLVTRGPYRHVRNPMYLGGGLLLGGAALVYRSIALLGYAAAFLLATHLFVIAYEEPALTRRFGVDYENYRRAVRRWVPRLRAARE